MINDQIIPESARKAIEMLHKAGYEGWLVGGCVRDTLRGVAPHDWDITTSAQPEETMEVFRGFHVIETGLKHGTVTVMWEGEPLEITTYRHDGEYLDHRRPQSVSFVRDLESDLVRRDFTMNAMAYSPGIGLRDPYGGREDLEKGLIRAVGDAGARFEEDALRILRAMRFSSDFGCSIEENTLRAMHEKKELLHHVSHERVLEEIRKMAVGANVLEVLMSCSAILAVVLPEIKDCIGFSQNNRHHIYDVWEHTARAVSAAPQDPILRLALLFHDVGKPSSYTVDQNGEGHFYGHAKLSGEMTHRALKRLKCDRYTMDEVVWLVSYHDYQAPPMPKHARRLLSRFGEERTRRLLHMKMADSSSHHPDFLERANIAQQLLDLVEEELAKENCLSLKDLAVKGGDMIALGLEGKAISEMLSLLLDRVVDGEVPNEKDALLALAASLKK